MFDEEKERARLKRWLEFWRKTDGVYSAFLKRWDLSLNAYFVLNELYRGDVVAEPARLAERVNVQRQLVTIVLRAFERRGFISLRENKTDHRRRTIRLTAAGRAFAKEVCGAVDRLDLCGLSVFSERERAALLDHAERFFKKIDAAANGNA